MIVTVTLNTCIDRVVEVPGFAVGATLKGRALRRQPAGKGINVSRCLAALGHQSVASGFVGRAERPAFATEMARCGLAELLVEVNGRTRDNITYLDPEAHTETHVREEGFEVNQGDLARLDSALAAAVHPGDVVVFAGSVPPGLRPTDLARLVAACRECGARVAVDCDGEPYRHAVDARPFLIKPNIAELRDLTGLSPCSPEEAAQASSRLLDRVEIVLASMGARGAVCTTTQQAWHARGSVDCVRSTVGCGDALLAGFLAAHEESAPLADCLRRAVACGGASAKHDIAGELDRRDVQELLHRVELRRIG